MRNEAVSREQSDFGRIFLKNFEECNELNDYVEAARLLIFKEQQNKQLQRLLHQKGETAAPTPASGPKQANLHFMKR
jgi:septation ring formation regulator EzrA